MALQDDLAGADAELLLGLQQEFEQVAAGAGPHLLCAAGCAACCHGPFPITRLDAWRLRQGLAALRRSDPEKAAAIERRAAAARAVLRRGFPGDPASGRLIGDEAGLDAFVALHDTLACPVLDPASGRCDLYAQRPVACRTFGPPLRFESERSDPCRLCFTTASPQEIEACRMRPDREGREEALLARLGVAPGEEWETLIAWTLKPVDGR